jgi:hypothetical protein
MVYGCRLLVSCWEDGIRIRDIVGFRNGVEGRREGVVQIAQLKKVVLSVIAARYKDLKKTRGDRKFFGWT